MKTTVIMYIANMILSTTLATISHSSLVACLTSLSLMKATNSHMLASIWWVRLRATSELFWLKWSDDKKDLLVGWPLEEETVSGPKNGNICAFSALFNALPPNGRSHRQESMKIILENCRESNFFFTWESFGIDVRYTAAKHSWQIARK